jgi:hypothetical protein
VAAVLRVIVVTGSVRRTRRFVIEQSVVTASVLVASPQEWTRRVFGRYEHPRKAQGGP